MGCRHLRRPWQAEIAAKLSRVNSELKARASTGLPANVLASYHADRRHRAPRNDDARERIPEKPGLKTERQLAMSILQSKLYRPATAPDLVARENLLARLQTSELTIWE